MREIADIQRFLDAQAVSFDQALAELTRGQKESHWMWYIFPQLAALGRSDTAKFFGIADLEEAQCYLLNQTLNKRLNACARAVLLHPDKSINRIMGAIDAVKLRSSATLFWRADGIGEIGQLTQGILDMFFKGQACPLTLENLEKS